MLFRTQAGFYVYAKPNKCDPKTIVKYIGHYLGRPVIATSRIDKYDGEMVTFHYNRHGDGQYMEETIPNSVVPFRSFNQWRTAILSSFGYDPLVCPDCQHRMNFWIWIIS